VAEPTSDPAVPINNVGLLESVSAKSMIRSEILETEGKEMFLPVQQL